MEQNQMDDVCRLPTDLIRSMSNDDLKQPVLMQLWDENKMTFRLEIFLFYSRIKKF
jgi:hypothetical protein